MTRHRYHPRWAAYRCPHWQDGKTPLGIRAYKQELDRKKRHFHLQDGIAGDTGEDGPIQRGCDELVLPLAVLPEDKEIHRAWCVQCRRVYTFRQVTGPPRLVRAFSLRRRGELAPSAMRTFERCSAGAAPRPPGNFLSARAQPARPYAAHHRPDYPLRLPPPFSARDRPAPWFSPELNPRAKNKPTPMLWGP